MSTLYEHWDGIDAVLATLDLPLPSDSAHRSREAMASEYWDLSRGYNGADACYRGGWADGAKRAYELAETLNPRPMASRTALRRSVTGAFPNVGAYLAGAPDSMYAVSKKQAHGRPYVHLVMPIQYNANIKAETAFERGCALVALADALETAGCRVQITGVCVIEYDTNNRLVQTFTLKDYADRMTVDQLIFTVAHPAFFRRLVVALFERSEYRTVRKNTHVSYGHAETLRDDDLPEQDARAVTVRFPRLQSNGMKAATFLAEMVKSLPETLQTTITESRD